MSQPRKAQGLGAHLRAIRKARNVTGRATAKRLGWSESKLSRLETGEQQLSPEDVSAFLAILDVTGDERDRLMAMARTPDEPAWLEPIRDGLPDESVMLSTYEAEAVRLTNWSLSLVPGMLQTMDYSYQFMLADGIPEAEVGTRLLARQHRQKLLERTEVEYVAFIDETVFSRRVGDELVRRNQWRHLLDMAERPNVSIRLIPVNSDAHSGLISPFLMIEFAQALPVVHVELARSGVFLSETAETKPYTDTVARLSSISMDQADSLRAIEGLLREKE